MEEKYDFDLTNEDGKVYFAKKIRESLDRFNDSDKDFLCKLLFLLLDSVCQHQVKLEAIDDFINGMANINK